MVVGLQFRTQGVHALHHSQWGRRDCDFLTQGIGVAVVGAVVYGFTPGEGREYVGKKAFRVYIAARLSQPLGSLALRGQVEVIHMKQRAAVEPGEKTTQSSFTCGAWTVQSHQSLGMGAAVAVDGGQQRQQPGQILIHDPVSGGVDPAVAVAVVDRRHAGLAVVLQNPIHFSPGKGQRVE